MSHSIAIALTTVQSENDAERLAAELLDRRLAACIQIDGPIVSHYRWQGKLERTTEYRLMIKLPESNWSRLSSTVDEIHPYDEPELIQLPVSAARQGYVQWVLDESE